MSQLILGIGNKARHGKDSFAAAVDIYYAKINATAMKHSLRLNPIVVQRHAFADALYHEVNDWLTTSEGERFRGLGGILLNKGYTVDPGAGFKEWISPGGIYLGKPTWEREPVIISDWVNPDPNPEVSDRSPYGKHPQLLQWWGTEFRRAQNPNYWVDKFVAGINSKADIVLVTDMRFLNEAERIKQLGGYTVQVNRLNQDGTPFVDQSRPANHVSEVQLDGYNYDYRITVKTGDLPLLEEWAITLVSFLRGWKGKR
jgi:hypothetical protein